MYRTDKSIRMIGFAVSTAMAGALLAGCATNAAPLASVSAEKATSALAVGKHDEAIAYAEAAVLADPRNAKYRATLAAAYMDAGRFSSAVQAYDDAETLGDTSARTQLSLALALMADGKNGEALGLLDNARSIIAPSDLGLAYALAGKPGHGIDILSVALRGGENTPKVRQNLAYAYALNGDWRDARLMAAEDVPADQVGKRMEEWAATVHPGAFRHRVAGLLGVPADAGDPGQPVALALGNFPTAEQLAAQSTSFTPAAPASPVTTELPPIVAGTQTVDVPASTPQKAPKPAAVAAAAPRPVATPAPVELPPLGDAPTTLAKAVSPSGPAASSASGFDAAFSAPAKQPSALAETTVVPRNVSRPVIQKIDAEADAPAPTANGSHLIQLGSFSSEANAKRAWSIYQKRYPELSNHGMVITEALVSGKRFWRVSAAGFASASAKNMCGKVKSRGKGCIAYSQDKPLPGAVDSGTRLARR